MEIKWSQKNLYIQTNLIVIQIITTKFKFAFLTKIRKTLILTVKSKIIFVLIFFNVFIYYLISFFWNCMGEAMHSLFTDLTMIVGLLGFRMKIWFKFIERGYCVNENSYMMPEPVFIDTFVLLYLIPHLDVFHWNLVVLLYLIYFINYQAECLRSCSQYLYLCGYNYCHFARIMWIITPRTSKSGEILAM